MIRRIDPRAKSEEGIFNLLQVLLVCSGGSQLTIESEGYNFQFLAIKGAFNAGRLLK